MALPASVLPCWSHRCEWLCSALSCGSWGFEPRFSCFHHKYCYPLNHLLPPVQYLYTTVRVIWGGKNASLLFYGSGCYDCPLSEWNHDKHSLRGSHSLLTSECVLSVEWVADSSLMKSHRVFAAATLPLQCLGDFNFYVWIFFQYHSICIQCARVKLTPLLAFPLLPWLGALNFLWDSGCQNGPSLPSVSHARKPWGCVVPKRERVAQTEGYRLGYWVFLLFSLSLSLVFVKQAFYHCVRCFVL